MRKLLLILILSPCVLFAQLSNKAEGVKENMTETYESIKYEAIKKWDTDYSMIVYQVNLEIDAMLDLLYKSRSSSFDRTVFFNALPKWMDSKEESFNLAVFEEIKKIDTPGDKMNKIFKLRCDWSMVKYEYDNQTSAKESL